MSFVITKLLNERKLKRLYFQRNIICRGTRIADGQGIWLKTAKNFNYAWFAWSGATQTSHWCSAWHGDYLWPRLFKLYMLLLQKNQFVGAFLDLERCDEFEDKGTSRSSKDGTFTCSACWEFAELCARCLLSFFGKILDDRRFHCFSNVPDFSDKWALEIVEILPLSRRLIKKIGNVSIFPVPSHIFTMMTIINPVHGVWKLRFSRSGTSVKSYQVLNFRNNNTSLDLRYLFMRKRVRLTRFLEWVLLLYKLARPVGYSV